MHRLTRARATSFRGEHQAAFGAVLGKVARKVSSLATKSPEAEPCFWSLPPDGARQRFSQQISIALANIGAVG